MNRNTRFVLFVCLYGVGAYIFSYIWGKAWFYREWIGPPEFLNKFLLPDGEAYYDIVFLEMYITSFVLLLTITGVIKLFIYIRSKIKR